MAIRTLPSQAYLRQCFDYDPETGVLTWRERPREHFVSESYQKRFNSRIAGARAGSKRPGSQHWEVSLSENGIRKSYLLHRVIWKMVHGDEPPEIDHINVDGGDNRIANLRACEHHQNMANTRIRRDNRTGARGVFQLPCGKYLASIQHKGVSMYIGRFVSLEAAAAAYAAKSQELHGEYAHPELVLGQ